MRHYKYVYGLHAICPVCGTHYQIKLIDEEAQDFFYCKNVHDYLDKHSSCSKCHGSLKFMGGSPLHWEAEA